MDDAMALLEGSGTTRSVLLLVIESLELLWDKILKRQACHFVREYMMFNRVPVQRHRGWPPSPAFTRYEEITQQVPKRAASMVRLDTLFDLALLDLSCRDRFTFCGKVPFIIAVLVKLISDDRVMCNLKHLIGPRVALSARNNPLRPAGGYVWRSRQCTRYPQAGQQGRMPREAEYPIRMAVEGRRGGDAW